MFDFPLYANQISRPTVQAKKKSLKTFWSLRTFIGQKRDMPILYFVATKNKSKQPALYGTTE